MQSSSPLHFPSTPAEKNARIPLNHTYRPLNSSPLAASPTSQKSSPTLAAQARRRSQYKTRAPSTPLPSSSRPRTWNPNFSRAASTSSASLFGRGNLASTQHVFGTAPSGENSQRDFLRENFKARCFERAARAREKAVRSRRYMGKSEPSSDGFDYSMDEDDEEDDEDIMQDELFRRIMENAHRKHRHSYNVSYSQNVGSSFDPDLEDISVWEHQLHERSSSSTLPLGPSPVSSQSEELTPIDLADEELAEYAEECAKRAALADFDDIPEEELFSWSDVEEVEGQHGMLDDQDMDMT